MAKEKINKNKSQNQGSSLTVRLVVPTIFMMAIAFVIVVFVGHRLNETLYNNKSIETLKNNLQLTEKALEEGWKNTRGTALRTEELLYNYTTKIMAGRLDFIGFNEDSGVTIIDSYNNKTIQTYPNNNLALKPSEVTNIVRIKANGYHLNTLEDGGFAVSTYFAPIGLHLVAFNKKSFAQTGTKEQQRIVLIFIFAITAVTLITLMLIIVHLSVTKPLSNIQKKIQAAIKDDRYSELLNTENGSKELQNLTTQFNTLMTHIDERDAQIHAHAEHLEAEVAARTHELKKAQEQLVLTERLAAIGEFASSVAHELRNPLSSIKLGVEKISEIKEIKGNNKRRLTLIENEVSRLSDMLSGILAFAAPTPIEMENVPLNNFIESNESLYQDIAESENIRLRILACREKLNVSADKAKLSQALINIIKNACEAAPANSEIVLKTKKTPQKAFIILENEGEAIPQEVLARLFEPFFTTKTSGTGLGLPTTKRLLNEMGGDIVLTNKENGKIETTITLKIAKANNT